MLETVIIATFGIFNTLRIVAYIPQIIAVNRDRNGATAVSFLTWGLWTCANASTAAYACVVSDDWALFLASASNTFFCLVVIVQTIVKRVQYARQMSEARIGSRTPRVANMAMMR